MSLGFRVKRRGGAAVELSDPSAHISGHVVPANCKMPTLLVCVEGNIGSGKSTLLNGIESLGEIGVVTLQEPVNAWRNVKIGGKNMLEAMYDGTISKSVFQLAVLQSRFGPLIAALSKKETKVVFSERGPWSEKYVFAKSNLPSDEFKCYEYAHSSLMRDLFPLAGEVIVVFLHLALPVDKTLERIKLRGRMEEANIDEPYIKKLEDANSLMLKALCSAEALGCETITGVHHLCIDANCDHRTLLGSAWKAVGAVADSL